MSGPVLRPALRQAMAWLHTWMGLLFGYIFKRWGLLSAIVTHALVDLLLPGLLVLWAYLSLAG